MKQLRHRLGVFLLGIMLLGTGVGSFFVYADNAAVSDEMWSTLDDMAHTFGLIDLEVNADDIVTRAEYVMLATKIMNLQERQIGGTYFSDVAPAHKAYGAINAAVDAGIIYGEGNGIFGPDNPISPEEAAIIAMRITGHSAVAEAEGGYPGGYQKNSAYSKIRSGVLNVGELTWKDALRIAWNLLDIDVMEQEVFGDKRHYKELDGVTVYEKYHDIVKFQGVIEDIDDLSITSREKLKEGTLRIGETLIQHNFAEPVKYFGRRVILYARELRGGEDYQAVYTQITRENRVVTVTADLIDGRTNKETVYYYSDENAVNAKRANIAEDAAVFYNEQYIGDAYTNLVSDDDLKLSQGTLTLIDNTNDGRADIVLINVFQNFAVNRSSENFIYLMYGAPAIDVSDEERVTIIKNNEKVTPSTLTKWDVLHVYTDKGVTGAGVNTAEKVRIVVGNEKVAGKLEQIRENRVTVSGKEFKVSDYYQTEGGGKETLKLGMEATFYLNLEGKIVYSDSGAVTNQYEYITSSHLDSVFGDVISIRMFGSNGMQVYKCSRINVENAPSPKGYLNLSCNAKELEEILRTDNNGVVTNETVNRLVQVEKNTDGNLKKIIFPILAQNEPLGHHNEFSLDDIMRAGENGISSISYFANRLNGKYFVPGTAKIFMIPVDKTQTENYQMISGDKISGAGASQLELYDITADNVANVIVLESNLKGKASVSFGSSWGVVDDTFIGINAEGETVEGISLYINGVSKSYTAVDSEVEHVADTFTNNTRFKHDGMKISELKKGDVIQVSLDQNDNLTSFRLILRYAPGQEGFTAVGENYLVSDYALPHSTMTMTYGPLVRSPESTGFVIQAGGEKVIRPGASRFSVRAYLYEVRADRVSVVSHQDVLPGDTVVVNWEWSAEKELVIFRD